VTLSPEEIATWSTYVGRTHRLTQVLDVESLRRFAVASSFRADIEAALLPLAHWAWFLSLAPDHELGSDGHPKRGNFLPSVSLPRRLFAGAKMSFDAPLELNAPAELVMTVADVSHKSGRTGDLVFIEVDRVLTQHARVRVRERQTIAYRAVDDAVLLPDQSENVPSKATIWTPSSVNLFRFSAATFNAHRIHYDHTYVTAEEGYPALVVHGPFTAVKLATLALGNQTRPLATFEFQSRAPLFVDQPIYLRQGDTDGIFEAIRCDGATAMTARAGYR
jgi:3-methylfumaryl-CoA hydratase